MKPETTPIQHALEPLLGLKLSIARRAVDMRIFHFGDIEADKNGTSGQYALHIQCPWCLDGPDGIVTGRRDLWEHISGEVMPDEWEPGIADNLQDIRLGVLLGGYDSDTRSHINATDILKVERVQGSDLGDVMIELSGGYRLTLFPAGTVGVEWRIFRPGDIDSHFVVEGEQTD